MLKSVNPATGLQIASYDTHSDEDVSMILTEVESDRGEWLRFDFAQRADFMRAAARLLEQRVDRYAMLMAEEMGKPLAQGRSEVRKCASVCDYYAEHAEAFLADEPIETDGSRSMVAYCPLGIVLAIMPWNFPFWQVFRFAAPNLMAGNAGVLKHAENVTGCGLAIERLFQDAGFPRSLFRTLVITTDQAPAVIEHPLVRAVTLTGSTKAGRSVASHAGKALKKTVLELGGSDPYIILADADIDEAAAVCVESRLVNSGQTCIAAKRMIVVEEIRERFERVFAKMMSEKKAGDPLSDKFDLGPLARHDLRDKLHRQVLESVARGARCIVGGTIPDDPGAYYPTTVLTDVGAGMPAYEEELFGPVAAIIPALNEEHAIRIANDTVYGLGAAIFTSDTERGLRIAKESLDAGACFVNGLVKSDPRLPFGGIKESGYGRELGRVGILEFVNTKTVWVK